MGSVWSIVHPFFGENEAKRGKGKEEKISKEGGVSEEGEGMEGREGVKPKGGRRVRKGNEGG